MGQFYISAEMLVHFLLSFWLALPVSSDFSISFLICQQMLHFKPEQRFLFRKGTQNGGFYTIPSFSVHMFLLYPTSFIVIELLSSLSFFSNRTFSSKTSCSLSPMSFLFPFYSSLLIYIHHLFYSIVHFCLNSFITKSFSCHSSYSKLAIINFSKSFLKWACQCVHARVCWKEREKIFRVFSNFIFSRQ